jgi:hypothetical protein
VTTKSATRSRTDHSRDDATYAAKLANRGYSVDQIASAIAKIPKGGKSPASMKYVRVMQERGLDAANAYAKRTAEKAVAWVKANPPVRDQASGLVRLAELDALVGLVPWGVVWSPRTRRVLEGALGVAEHAKSLRFSLALRQWSTLTGVAYEPIRWERNRLIEIGWLRRNQNDRSGRTSRFGLRAPLHIQGPRSHSTFTSHEGRCECGVVGREGCWLAHDAFRPQALGDVGWYALASTSDQAVTLRELELQTGIAHDELLDLVLTLDRFGAARFDGSLVRRGPDLVAGLDAIAAHHGTEGMLAAERAQYDEERKAFRARGTGA